MGKKILSVGFVVAMVGLIVLAAVRVAMMPEEERKNGANKGPQGIALSVRDGFAESVDEALGGREAKLGLAYLVGMKDGLDDETKEMLRAVGLSHLVVASGTHLAIIVEFIKKRFGKVSRFAGLLFSTVCILIFGQIVGWTASITRAAIVAGLSLLGWYYGRKIGAGKVILIAMAATLTINPLYVVDVGWLLSFASFIGIMVIAPMMKEFFYGRRKETKKPGAVAEMLMASVAATVMCAPILVYYFGSISVISLVANVLILPTIPFAMGMTALVGLIGLLPAWFLVDFIEWFVVKITTLLLDYHLAVMEFFSKQTAFIVTMPKGNPLVWLWYVPIVVLMVVWWWRTERRRRKNMLQVWGNPEKYLPFTSHA